MTTFLGDPPLHHKIAYLPQVMHVQAVPHTVAHLVITHDMRHSFDDLQHGLSREAFNNLSVTERVMLKW